MIKEKTRMLIHRGDSISGASIWRMILVTR